LTHSDAARKARHADAHQRAGEENTGGRPSPHQLGLPGANIHRAGR